MNVFRNRIIPIEFDFPELLEKNLHLNNCWREPSHDVKHLGHIRYHASLCDGEDGSEVTDSETELVSRYVPFDSQGPGVFVNF